MGLRMKFNLVLFVAICAGLAIAGVFSNKLLNDNAREEVLQSARIMMESAIAVRGYTVKEVKPLLAVQQRRHFISQTVPAYAASQYIKRLQKKHPEYSYKEATLNPTNPANRATEWETDIVSYFRNHDTEKELVGERNTPTGPQLYLSRPIKITNPACLSCHSTPAEAPETLINTYGDNNGFGWKLDEVIGAQIVSVPMSLPLKRANSTFITFMIALVGVFVLLIILLNIMLHYIVLKPVSAMSKKADAVSLGDLTVEELVIKGNDEISSLGRSFNRMHRSLDNAVKLLDETIDDE
ncbi:signal protein [Gammaproteobacteria bacterium 42_54_T18]|nr:signal protein [Gammaproteobacteria bacterium 42_54_T18]